MVETFRREQEFVAAIRQFAVRLTGTFGDERSQLRNGIDAMAAALGRWDQAITDLEGALGRVLDADAHVALGTVYLDRYRVADALREFRAAVKLDTRRAEVYELIALAEDLANRPSEALQALLAAVALAPDDPVLHYEIGRHHLEMDETEALAAFRTLRVAADKRLAATSREGGTGLPFTARQNEQRQTATIARGGSFNSRDPILRLSALERSNAGFDKQCRRSLTVNGGGCTVSAGLPSPEEIACVIRA
ncbi:MAG: hypothetical protein C5B57_07975 [Blastocatellia bacterium]|nr:MAG: hypothetical protein C5B57_07975 [Blastocatellia bacterium]